MKSILLDYELLLGSASPRRHELLYLMNLPYRVVKLHVDESYPPELVRQEIPEYLSRKKALAYFKNLHPNEILITADTIVWHKDHPLEKPRKREEAIEMLRELSCQWHQVYTGVTLSHPKLQTTFSVCTDVFFEQLNDEEIEFYVDDYKPFDKAGSYGMQEWLGIVKVREIKGSYTNVVGLPTAEVYKNLKQFIALIRNLKDEEAE
ncbi:Maf-like protein [Thermaurantimonas aggregans]|uniref:dTTP/UTP pyrophosphatase n=1 Tax=Thermaurantimonas aggregans TaxID=2173829 RepID=A0A401XJ10_9FLAO|nr:Maf family nucleotide pyrophosphatase [Thermaurantimonas aggregans]MCX8148969.1 Maf family nucleotide pyrophosphatase [Thermaurantimonas aggregans]GCD77015.1 Maf-like protein [Thermaurantimonas aggregans]